MNKHLREEKQEGTRKSKNDCTVHRARDDERGVEQGASSRVRKLAEAMLSVRRASTLEKGQRLGQDAVIAQRQQTWNFSEALRCHARPIRRCALQWAGSRYAVCFDTRIRCDDRFSRSWQTDMPPLGISLGRGVCQDKHTEGESEGGGRQRDSCYPIWGACEDEEESLVQI
jgi:hypothetical protein